VVARVAVLACALALAPAARAAWDCGVPGQPACPAADTAGPGGALAVASPLRPLPAPVPGQRLFARVNGHLAAGFNEGSVGLGITQPAEAAALGAGLGSSLVRIALNWAFTQARVGGDGFPPDWRAWDERYRAYTALGIRPIWAIQASPRWAVDPDAASSACPTRPLRLLQSGQECLVGPAPDHRADYAAFAAQVARRYPLSAAVEIWNEPNLAYYWRGPDPASYGALARAATSAIRRANPAMRVLVGALAVPLYEDRGNVRLEAFASALARDGTIAAADGVSFHPYPQELDARPFRDAFAQVDAALGTLRTRLVTDELGASTSDRGHGQYRFSDTEQRDIVVATFEAMDAADPSLPRSRDVDGVVFHTDVDGAGGFGFVSVAPQASGGFAPKPVYCAIAQLLRGAGLCGLPAAAPAITPAPRRAARACAAARRKRTAARAAPARSPRARAAAGAARARQRSGRARGRRLRCGRLRPGRYTPPRRSGGLAGARTR
jgi:hypothetical protein